MIERLLNYGAVYVGSMFKFIIGPVAGTASELSIIETSVLTALGMMTTVLLVSLLKDDFRRKLVWKFKRDKRLFTRKNRQLVRIWSRYGLKGVAFITPIFLMPIGGAIIAMSFGGKRARILKYMAISAVFWSFVTTFAVHYLGSLFAHIF